MKLYKPIYSGRKSSRLSNVELLVSYVLVNYLFVSYLLVNCLVALVSCLYHVHASGSWLIYLIEQV